MAVKAGTDPGVVPLPKPEIEPQETKKEDEMPNITREMVVSHLKLANEEVVSIDVKELMVFVKLNTGRMMPVPRSVFASVVSKREEAVSKKGAPPKKKLPEFTEVIRGAERFTVPTALLEIKGYDPKMVLGYRHDTILGLHIMVTGDGKKHKVPDSELQGA